MDRFTRVNEKVRYIRKNLKGRTSQSRKFGQIEQGWTRLDGVGFCRLTLADLFDLFQPQSYLQSDPVRPSPTSSPTQPYLQSDPNLAQSDPSPTQYCLVPPQIPLESDLESTALEVGKTRRQNNLTQ